MNQPQTSKEVKLLCWMDERYAHILSLSLTLELGEEGPRRVLTARVVE
jgi:hypothetical protein